MATGGMQTFNDGVTASANVTFTGIAGVNFNSSLTGNVTVVVNSSAATRFGGEVTVGSLTTDAPGTTTIDTAVVATAGDLIFNDAVLLGVNTRASSANASILFSQSIVENNGATASLTTDAGNGDVTFANPVSLATTAILTIDHVRNFSLNNGFSGGSLTENVGSQAAVLNGPINVAGRERSRAEHHLAKHRYRRGDQFGRRRHPERHERGRERRQFRNSSRYRNLDRRAGQQLRDQRFHRRPIVRSRGTRDSIPERHDHDEGRRREWHRHHRSKASISAARSTRPPT